MAYSPSSAVCTHTTPEYQLPNGRKPIILSPTYPGGRKLSKPEPPAVLLSSVPIHLYFLLSPVIVSTVFLAVLFSSVPIYCYLLSPDIVLTVFLAVLLSSALIHRQLLLSPVIVSTVFHNFPAQNTLPPADNAELDGQSMIKANGKYFKCIIAVNNYVQTFTFGEDCLPVQVETIENCKLKIATKSTAYAKLPTRLLENGSWQKSK